MLILRRIRKLETTTVFLQMFKHAGSTLIELHCRFFRKETEPCLFWQYSTKDSAHHIAGAQCWFVEKNELYNPSQPSEIMKSASRR